MNILTNHKLKLCTYEKFIDFLTSKCTKEERAEIEALLSGNRELQFMKKVAPLNPTTLEPMTKEEMEQAKEKYEKRNNTYINVHLYFADKYRKYQFDDPFEFKIKEISSKDGNAYRSYMQRPFENCIKISGISKDYIDSLSEEKKNFLSNFSVIEVSDWYECYDLIIYFNTKDGDGNYYITDISFILRNNN